MPKSHSGIRRVAKSGGSQAKTSANSDIVFKTRLETDEEAGRRRTQRGRLLRNKISPEALNALNALPEGAEFTVYYVGFGSSGTTRYAIGTHGMSTRTVTKINEDGTHDRYRVARTKSQLRDVIRMDIANTITIHNGGKSMAAERLKQAEERYKEMQSKNRGGKK